MGVKCKHYKLCSVLSKLVYFSQFWGMKHFLGPVCDIRPFKDSTNESSQGRLNIQINLKHHSQQQTNQVNFKLACRQQSNSQQQTNQGSSMPPKQWQVNHTFKLLC